MQHQSQGSVSHWIEGLRDGDSASAQELWNRYFARLKRIAEAKLSSLARGVSGEDIALSAMKSVMMGVQQNRFPDLADRTNLWPLLVTITARKVISEQRRQLAVKRPKVACSLDAVQDYIGVEPTPEFAAEVVDELEHLVNKLDDPTLATITHMKLSGFSNEEIASQLDCSTRTVVRKLKLIREEWALIAGIT